MKESFYNTLSFNDFEDLKTQMAQWLIRYNNRPHSSLRNRYGKRVWLSPIQKREELLEQLKEEKELYHIRFIKKSA